MEDLKIEDIANGIKQVVENADYDRDKLKGYELLGKAKGMYTDKIKHELPQDIVIRWAGKDSSSVSQ